MLNFANSTVGYKNWCFISIKFDFEKSGWFVETLRSLRSKSFVCILIFLVFFSKSGIQYLWQKEISIFKVQVQIKVVLGKNDYFFHQKFELHWWQMNGFLYWCSFYRKKIGAYISLKLIVWLIPTWIWYDLLAVSHL